MKPHPISPPLQYMGDSVPEKVKMKIIEMLYSWTVVFPNEAKISEAYQTLRRQGERQTTPSHISLHHIHYN